VSGPPDSVGDTFLAQGHDFHLRPGNRDELVHLDNPSSIFGPFGIRLENSPVLGIGDDDRRPVDQDPRPSSVNKTNSEALGLAIQDAGDPGNGVERPLIGMGRSRERKE
jgi:hypothetical protein